MESLTICMNPQGLPRGSGTFQSYFFPSNDAGQSVSADAHPSVTTISAHSIYSLVS